MHEIPTELLKFPFSHSLEKSTNFFHEMGKFPRYAITGLKVNGLVDLGKHTPEKLKNKPGHHALVLMFQPFQGQWVQVIGAFLSAGAVPGEVLHKILLEGILLLENAGFFVDCVPTDGATWNRSMWDSFGVSKERNSCEHPVDTQRNLYMASDFSHLMKNLWVRLVNNKVLNVRIALVNHYFYYKK